MNEIAAILLAREAGYLKTSVACKRLDIGARELLRLRREMLLKALGAHWLPELAKMAEGQEFLRGMGS